MNYWQYQNGIWTGSSDGSLPLITRLPSWKSASSSFPRPFTICVVGAGGKTTLLLELMREYLAAGLRVLVTTTTHMFLPESRSILPYLCGPEMSSSLPYLCSPETQSTLPHSDHPAAYASLQPLHVSKMPSVLPHSDTSESLSFLGTPVTPPLRQNGWVKCQAPPASDLARLSMQKDIVLIEADGSRRLPLKVPDAHEPVIPAQTNLILAVYGLSALGQEVSRCCQRHELLEQKLPGYDLTGYDLPGYDLTGYDLTGHDLTGYDLPGYDLTDYEQMHPAGVPPLFPVPERGGTVTPQLMAHMMRRLYLEPLQKKYPEVPVIPVWNQADTPELRNTARDIARECGWHTQFLTAFKTYETGGYYLEHQNKKDKDFAD